MLGKGDNRNHPKKGSSVLVQPIRSIEHIEKIITLLKDKPRDKLLFVMAINNGLRAGDILKLRVSDVMHLRVGGFTIIKEQKTGKHNYVWINEAVYEAMVDYLKKCKPHSKDWLFASQIGGKPITVQYVNNLVKRWGKAVGIKENLGSHSLRKSFGYHQRVNYGTSIELISKRFKHSDPRITMVYCGIEETEVHAIMQNSIGKRRA
jgi:integrase